MEFSHVFLNKKKMLITSKTFCLNKEHTRKQAFSERSLKLLNLLAQTDAARDDSLLLSIFLPIPPEDQTLGVTEK